ncbi:MAG: ATP-dependent zinc metalloprotease FtsH [Candidatus Coatesbacteria bacterium]|nr:ATP-dependent zinc metalloprotease FtsH [Candidatus Coatesbacteria bacterium]
MAKSAKTFIFWIVIALLSYFIFVLVGRFKEDRVNIPYSQFRELLEKSDIKEITFEERQIEGELKTASLDIPDNPMADQKKKTAFFNTYIPFDDNTLVETLKKQGVLINAKPKGMNWFGVFLSWLPLLIIIIFWLSMMRLNGKGIFSFGKSKARLLSDQKLKVTFKDVAGVDEAKEELGEIIDFLKNPKKFQQLGGKIPKGVLLLGPPGTGKTLLARAVAGEADVSFFSISGSDFVELFVGVGASRVRDLFDQGKKSAPCIIFIDEIDAVGRHRGAGLGGGHDEREQTLNALLVEMDGFITNEGVIIIAATNRPDVLDPALLRPGRFDRQVVVDQPDVKGREGILQVHVRKVPLGSDVNLQVLARGTPGFSGADLANLVNEAALLAARKNKTSIEMEDFEAAKDKVLMGAERRSLVLSEKEKLNTATHEAGHTLVSRLIPGMDPIHKVTIIPRGRALGLTQALPLDEKHSFTKTFCEDQIAFMLGGRAAEWLMFKELSTGAGNDLERATALARKMICEWGMSEKMGPVTFGEKQENIFLGREFIRHKEYSEQTAILIDNEIQSLILKQYERAVNLLKDNLDRLKKITDALIQMETLAGDDIDMIIFPERFTETKEESGESDFPEKTDEIIQEKIKELDD